MPSDVPQRLGSELVCSIQVLAHTVAYDEHSVEVSIDLKAPSRFLNQMHGIGLSIAGNDDDIGAVDPEGIAQSVQIVRFRLPALADDENGGQPSARRLSAREAPTLSSALPVLGVVVAHRSLMGTQRRDEGQTAVSAPQVAALQCLILARAEVC